MDLKIVSYLSAANIQFSVLILCAVKSFQEMSYQKILFMCLSSALKATTKSYNLRARKLDCVNWKQSKAQAQTATLTYAEHHALKHPTLFTFAYQAWLRVLHLESGRGGREEELAPCLKGPQHWEKGDKDRQSVGGQDTHKKQRQTHRQVQKW